MSISDDFVNAIQEVMLDMYKREVDMYWYGQLTAALDSKNIDIGEFLSEGKLVRFESEES